MDNLDKQDNLLLKRKGTKTDNSIRGYKLKGLGTVVNLYLGTEGKRELQTETVMCSNVFYATKFYQGWFTCKARKWPEEHSNLGQRFKQIITKSKF